MPVESSAPTEGCWTFGICSPECATRNSRLALTHRWHCLEDCPVEGQPAEIATLEPQELGGTSHGGIRRIGQGSHR